MPLRGKVRAAPLALAMPDFFIVLYRIPCSACRRALPCFAVNLLRLDCQRTRSHPTGRGPSACVPAASAFGSVQTRGPPPPRGGGGRGGGGGGGPGGAAGAAGGGGARLARRRRPPAPPPPRGGGAAPRFVPLGADVLADGGYPRAGACRLHRSRGMVSLCAGCEA